MIDKHGKRIQDFGYGYESLKPIYIKRNSKITLLHAVTALKSLKFHLSFKYQWFWL